MQAAVGEVDGVPAQRDQLARPQAMPVGDQHHGGVAVAIAILRQRPRSAERPRRRSGTRASGPRRCGAARWSGIVNCPNNGGWRHQRQMRICHDFSGFSACYCPIIGCLRDTAQGEKRRLYGHNCHLWAPAEPVSMQETLNWPAFSVGCTEPPQRNGQQRVAKRRKILQSHKASVRFR